MMLSNKGTVTLISDRLVLRKFAKGDGEDMFKNWTNDAEICRFLTWDPHGSIETTQGILSAWISSYEYESCYNWCIEYDGQSIGGITVVDYSDKHLWCEIGYCMGKAFWNRGLMTEALKEIIEFLFLEVGFNRISARHDTENEASGKVMLKSGMTLEGTTRQVHIRRDGTFADLNIYAILRDEWLLKQNALRH